MGFTPPIAPDATWPINSDSRGHGDAARAGRASPAAAVDPLPWIGYSLLRKLVVEFNWFGQAAALVAALDEISEQIHLCHAAVMAAAQDVFAPPSAYPCPGEHDAGSADAPHGASAPVVTPGLMAAYGQALSAVPSGVGALSAPVSVFDSGLLPALTSLAQLGALSVTVASTPIAPPESVGSDPLVGSVSAVADQRLVSASLGSACAVEALSVPGIWAAATAVCSGVADRDESRYVTGSFAAAPVNGSDALGRRRLHAVTTT